MCWLQVRVVCLVLSSHYFRTLSLLLLVRIWQVWTVLPLLFYSLLLWQLSFSQSHSQSNLCLQEDIDYQRRLLCSILLSQPSWLLQYLLCSLVHPPQAQLIECLLLPPHKSGLPLHLLFQPLSPRVFVTPLVSLIYNLWLYDPLFHTCGISYCQRVLCFLRLV